MLSEKDRFFLLEALEEAKKGSFYTHPNPLVGCVIVKNGRIISRGFHKFFGGPHAEVNAIKKLSYDQLKNSTMYVTLEPCSTFGKTPPCTDFIIKSGIKKVVCGSIDPNPLHNGKGVEILRRAGIKCLIADGRLKEMCIEINRVFFKNMLRQIPYVSLKIAISLDGKIADFSYNSKWISSVKSRKKVQQLRAFSDCILVGSNTIKVDNPYLNVRDLDVKRQPDVCIIGDLNVKSSLNIFKTKNRRFFLVSNSNVKTKSFMKLEIHKLNNVFNLNELLEKLFNFGIRHILVEGGAFTVSQFIKQNCFDRIIVFVSPLVIGKGLIWFDDIIEYKNDKLGLRLKLVNFERFDDDLMMELKNV